MKKNYGRALAEAALTIGAIKFSPDQPFCWASGYYMPIYNDNRLLLGYPEYRELCVLGFVDLLATAGIAPQAVVGVATAGIPHATGLANHLQLPLCYVRGASKDHGLMNRIEGRLGEGQRVVVVEDLVSTGGSSVEAVRAVREAGAEVEACVSIFSYGLAKAESLFREEKCPLLSILTYRTLIDSAREQDYLDGAAYAELEAWQTDPFGWGAARGFPQRQK